MASRSAARAMVVAFETDFDALLQAAILTRYPLAATCRRCAVR
jgi:hypothetical protein